MISEMSRTTSPEHPVSETFQRASPQALIRGGPTLHY